MRRIRENCLNFNFRCKVPECEFGVNNRDLMYSQSWLNNTIPQLDEKFDSCHRYAPMENLTSIELSSDKCAAEMFDSSQRISCSEYIYTSDEKNIQTEVGKYANILSITSLNDRFSPLTFYFVLFIV